MAGALSAGGRPALVLIGFMGAGKSTAARALDAAATDTDALVEARVGSPVAEFFAAEGEAAFRAVEEEVAAEALERADGGVIALGGGALGSERVRRALARHRAVLLDVGVEDAWSRAQGGGRPLAGDPERFRALHAAREPAYLAAANAIVPADRPGRVAEAREAIAALGAAPDGTTLLWAAGGTGGYPVYVGEGLLGSGLWPVSGRRFLVTDQHVGPRYGPALGDGAGEVVLPPGEGAKTLAQAERVWRAMAAAGLTREDHVAALGGGVVGDLAGFCAATYQRGIPVVQVPTTVVAQVDSAYGGKTGIDLPEAKNYVGAYHPPAAVLVDPLVLATLPAAEVAAGWAEVVKTALIAGGRLWERVRALPAPAPDAAIVVACARVKLAIVAADERDAGRRQVLNLGHTVGHAVEVAAGYGRYRHGEAVGLGLLAALRVSGQDDLRAEVRDLLAAAGLPTRLEGVDVAVVLAAVGRDKKRRGEGPVPFVLVEAPGAVHEGRPVPEGALRAAVEELCS